MDLIKHDGFYIHKDMNGDEIGRYFYVINEGYPKGVSEYFIATREQFKELKYINTVKWSIYSIEKGRLTGEFDWINTNGLVKNQSKYFLAKMGDSESFYTLDGKISDDFEKIRDRGALTGESRYFWGKRKGKFAIYDVETNQKLTEDYTSSVIAGVIVGNGDYYIASYDKENFFIFDLSTNKKLSKPFDEHKLIQILKEKNIERALEELGK